LTTSFVSRLLPIIYTLFPYTTLFRSNKDRWLAAVDLAQARLQPRHRLTDPAWINWNFNDFGWLPDNRTLWFLSEESGWSHLYTQDRKSTRLNSSHVKISYAVFCLKKK